jgi:hypothetical protein
MDIFSTTFLGPSGKKALVAAVKVSLSVGMNNQREVMCKAKGRIGLAVAPNAFLCDDWHNIAPEIDGSPLFHGQSKLD